MQREAVPDLYPSRVQDLATIEERKDPVSYGGAGPLTAEQLTQYESRGYLVLDELFSPDEVESMRAEVTRVVANSDETAGPEIIREPGGHEVRSIFAVHQSDPTLNRLIRDPRLMSTARQVLGGNVYIHQSRINFKPGFTGKEFYWHSDFETWHVEDGMPRMRALSFSILLDDNLPFNGSLMLVPGSHRHYVTCVGKTPKDHYKQSLRRQDYGVPDHDSLWWLVDQFGLDMPTAKAGSVLMFDCNIMHGSNSNITPFPRRNIFAVYNSMDNALIAPFSGEEPRPAFVAARSPELVIL